MGHRLSTLAATILVTATSCGGGDGAPLGTFRLPSPPDDSTVYVDVVVADPPGDDLAEGAGEHIIIRNNTIIRIDVGGWWFTIAGHRLPLGVGRQIDADDELRVHSGPGTTAEDAVFVGLSEEALPDEGGVLVLHDASGDVVGRFPYGNAR